MHHDTKAAAYRVQVLSLANVTTGAAKTSIAANAALVVGTVYIGTFRNSDGTLAGHSRATAT